MAIGSSKLGCRDFRLYSEVLMNIESIEHRGEDIHIMYGSGSIEVN